MRKLRLACNRSGSSSENARSKHGRASKLWLSVGTVCVAICVGIYGCSASSGQRGDLPAHAQNADIAPEQCLTNAALQTAADQQNYHIQPGDQLAINFYLSPEFNDQVTVEPDGRIVLRLVGAVMAAGMTPAQLAGEIDKAYMTELRSPDSSVEVKNMPGRQVYVQGQVNHPGAFPLQPGMTALQAVADAGGLTDGAADDDVVLIRRDACGRPTGEKLDLASAAGNPGKGDDTQLMPYDVLVVPRSRIANMDLFVKQYIQGLLPVQPYLSLTPGI